MGREVSFGPDCRIDTSRASPRRRTPLWAQRRRAGDLLSAVANFPSFPIVLEAYRECLADAFDMPGLIEMLRRVESRRTRVVTVTSRTPSLERHQ